MNMAINDVLIRSVLFFFSSFFLILIFGNKTISFLKSVQKQGQPIRELGPESHLLTKKGTPTMGGVMIIGAVLIPGLFLLNFKNYFIIGSLIVFVGYGLLGALDDIKKLLNNNHYGVSAKQKLLGQLLFAVLGCGFIFYGLPEGDRGGLNFPFLKDYIVNFLPFTFVFGILIIIAASNAVNLTDGLDGLVSFPVILTTLAMGIIALLSSHLFLSYQFSIPFIPEAYELIILCGGVIGAVLGFLWFNGAPAQIFMGDTGSLALGGLLGAISICLKHEYMLGIVGFIFVIETLSVILQVAYFKKTKGKRLFLMSPIHHHFEKKGWPETKVVLRFWIVSFLSFFMGLMFLHLRW